MKYGKPIRGLATLTALLSCTILGYSGEINFTPVKAPETDEEKRSILVSPSAMVDGEEINIGYQTILRSGEQAGDHVFGQLIDAAGNSLISEDGSKRISNSNDFSSLLNLDSGLFMVSHFESRPGAMYLSELDQNPQTGMLSAVSTRPLNFSGVRGGWVHCAGSVTPWNTHLGGEEYEPDMRQRDPVTGEIDDYYAPMADYYAGDLLELNPYDYGWPIEVKVRSFENATVTKHYAIGRLAIELPYVMPDQRTVYISDDGTNVGFYMFIADRAGDLSAGNLYAMRWQQISAEHGGSARIRWVPLGHADSKVIKRFVDARLSLSDLFDVTDPDEQGRCPAGLTSVNHGHDDGMQECLRVRPGMDTIASRLETRRYAALQGATTELRKGEGITFDPRTSTLYFAVSDLARGMEDFSRNGSPNSKYDVGGPNHIRLPYNACGTVYGMKIQPGFSLGSRYVAQSISGIVEGKMTQAYDPSSPIPAYDPDGPFSASKCSLDGIASPDNLTFMPGYNTLIIGEDTGSGHQNDMVWAYNLSSKKLTRIQTTPYGSETTSPYFYPNINGWAYLMSVVQHPFGESDKEKMNDPAELRGYTGYIGPFPAMD